MLLNRRERTQNWTPKEKSALFSLIKSHVHVIENKKIDMATSAMKCHAWQQIHCAFRSRFSTDRDVTRIKEQWRRMKAQARMEINAYSEKVRTLGPEAAARPSLSALSIEIWRLMESMRTNDAEVIRHSDDSNQDNENLTSRAAICAMLDELMSPLASETSVAPGHEEIKIEAGSDAEDENSCSELNSQKSSDDFSLPKRLRIAVDHETADVVERKSPCLDSVSTPRVDDAAERNATPSVSASWNGPATTSNREELLQKAMWIFKSSQREHEIKLQMLHVELERAQLQKQTAINELKTSEMKKQMMETQAVTYYRSFDHSTLLSGKKMVVSMLLTLV